MISRPLGLCFRVGEEAEKAEDPKENQERRLNFAEGGVAGGVGALEGPASADAISAKRGVAHDLLVPRAWYLLGWYLSHYDLKDIRREGAAVEMRNGIEQRPRCRLVST